MRNMIVSAMAALVCVACAAQTEPTGTAQKTDEYSVQGFALKIDPTTQKVQTCTPPYDPSCSSFGPDDELRCIPTSKTAGDCSFRHSDNSSVYDGVSQTNGYIPCPGTGMQADDDYCTSVNPYTNKKDYVSVCLVTEATFNSSSPDAGRCAYFFKECTVAANTPCEQKGITLPCSNSVCECSVSADLTKKGVESCDSIDNNCDGFTDEEDALGCKSFWTDADGDGYGSGGAQMHCMCGSPAGMVANNSDCNDSSKSVNPTASESCNGVDDNCDGQTDEGVKLTFYADADGDLHGNPQSSLQSCTAPSGYVADKTDCNDLDKSVNPMALESCNLVDDNCDGQTDEGTQLTFYKDADGDTYGDASKTTLACTAPSGYVADKTDCNDLDKTVHPVAAESCNGVDDNCDGQTDEGVKLTFYADADADTYGDVSKTTLACTAPSGYVADKTDCNDGDNSVNPKVAESCNGVDDNCDGQTDEGVKLTFYADADADTYGDVSKTTLACVAPLGYVADKTDCNDSLKSVHPGAVDECNQVDDDCDGQTDMISGQYQCDLQCPTVQKFDCNKEYTVDFSAQPGTNAISSYQCWTAAGAKTLSTNYSAAELTAAPNAPIGTKFSFQITSTGTGALAAMLQNTCEPNKNSSSVTAYNLANNLNGTCAAFSSSSVNNGVAGTNYIALDKPTAVGVVKFKFVCAP